MAINLANQHGSEGLLGKSFIRENTRFAGSTSGMRLVSFDFHKVCGSMHYERWGPLLPFRLTKDAVHTGLAALLSGSHRFTVKAHSDCTEAVDCSRPLCHTRPPYDKSKQGWWNWVKPMLLTVAVASSWPLCLADSSAADRRLDLLWREIAEDFQRFGWWQAGGQAHSRRQAGVLRVNCIDCLDRTNVGQGFIARHHLEAVLRELGALPGGGSLPTDLPAVSRLPPHLMRCCVATLQLCVLGSSQCSAVGCRFRGLD